MFSTQCWHPPTYWSAIELNAINKVGRRYISFWWVSGRKTYPPIIDELIRTLELRVEGYPIANSKHRLLYMLMIDINSNRHRVQPVFTRLESTPCSVCIHEVGIDTVCSLYSRGWNRHHIQSVFTRLESTPCAVCIHEVGIDTVFSLYSRGWKRHRVQSVFTRLETTPCFARVLIFSDNFFDWFRHFL